MKSKGRCREFANPLFPRNGTLAQSLGGGARTREICAGTKATARAGDNNDAIRGGLRDFFKGLPEQRKVLRGQRVVYVGAIQRDEDNTIFAHNGNHFRVDV